MLKIQNDNCMKYYFDFQDKFYRYQVFEYIDGITLSEYLKINKIIPEEITIEIFK